jgi:octanoyl-[GcvH]:protein N-octanoyltransferase
MHDRFARSGSLFAAALRTLGVDSRVGRVPDEFCPGDFTVNARGAVKLVGTAQRVVRHASLLAASVAVHDAGRLRAVLRDVYRELELDWDPATVGAVADEVSGVTVDDVERAVLDAYGVGGPPAVLDAATLDRAWALEPRHAVTTGSPAAPTRSRRDP